MTRTEQNYQISKLHPVSGGESIVFIFIRQTISLPHKALLYRNDETFYELLKIETKLKITQSIIDNDPISIEIRLLSVHRSCRKFLLNNRFNIGSK